MKNLNFDAWEGRFTPGQIRDIIQMSLYAHKNGAVLHKALTKHEVQSKRDKETGYVKKPVRKCPQCGGVLKVFSLNKKEMSAHPGMKSKWECCKTCKSSGCGYVEFLNKTVEQLIAEVKNGAPK